MRGTKLTGRQHLANPSSGVGELHRICTACFVFDCTDTSTKKKSRQINYCSHISVLTYRLIMGKLSGEIFFDECRGSGASDFSVLCAFGGSAMTCVPDKCLKIPERYPMFSDGALAGARRRTEFASSPPRPLYFLFAQS
ncbi:MAG: hypothetical protein P4L81_03035, partial [Candidatus Pacebacteria bacterium]|nr:hypothetical protein [Candidatus Paceibacterota bacterium]